MANRAALIVVGGFLALVVLVALIVGLYVRNTYNGLVEKPQAIDAQWAQVETQYQRLRQRLRRRLHRRGEGAAGGRAPPVRAGDHG